MRVRSEVSRSNKKWFFGFPLILLGISFISFFAIQDNAVYFYTPLELKEKAKELFSQEVRAGGMVKKGSVLWKPENLSVNFILSDMKGTEIQVAYQGAPPDMFKEGSGVVVEGFVGKEGLTFKARNLFVKHSEEYKIPEDVHEINPQLVQKSIIKNETL